MRFEVEYIFVDGEAIDEAMTVDAIDDAVSLAMENAISHSDEYGEPVKRVNIRYNDSNLIAEALEFDPDCFADFLDDDEQLGSIL